MIEDFKNFPVSDDFNFLIYFFCYVRTVTVCNLAEKVITKNITNTWEQSESCGRYCRRRT